jgi:hypothetical protein
MGLKNIHLFAQALATKNVWGIISNTGLWAHIVKEKYFPSNSIIDWVMWPQKSSKNGSVIWKAMVNAFPLIGTGLYGRLEMVQTFLLENTHGLNVKENTSSQILLFRPSIMKVSTIYNKSLERICDWHNPLVKLAGNGT